MLSGKLPAVAECSQVNCMVFIRFVEKTGWIFCSNVVNVYVFSLKSQQRDFTLLSVSIKLTFRVMFFLENAEEDFCHPSLNNSIIWTKETWKSLVTIELMPSLESQTSSGTCGSEREEADISSTGCQVYLLYQYTVQYLGGIQKLLKCLLLWIKILTEADEQGRWWHYPESPALQLPGSYLLLIPYQNGL